MSSPTRVTVIGTGTIGAPVARNLVHAGFDVTGWNRSAGRAQPLRDDGVMLAAAAPRPPPDDRTRRPRQGSP